MLNILFDLCHKCKNGRLVFNEFSCSCTKCKNVITVSLVPIDKLTRRARIDNLNHDHEHGRSGHETTVK